MLDQILKNKAGPERAEIMKKACQVRVYERKKFVREKDCREIGFILSPPPTVIPLRDSLNEFLVMDTPHFLSTTVILCCVFYRILTLFWRKHYNYRSRMITSRLVLSALTVWLLCFRNSWMPFPLCINSIHILSLCVSTPSQPSTITLDTLRVHDRYYCSFKSALSGCVAVARRESMRMRERASYYSLPITVSLQVYNISVIDGCSEVRSLSTVSSLHFFLSWKWPSHSGSNARTIPRIITRYRQCVSQFVLPYTSISITVFLYLCYRIPISRLLYPYIHVTLSLHLGYRIPLYLLPYPYSEWGNQIP